MSTALPCGPLVCVTSCHAVCMQTIKLSLCSTKINTHELLSQHVHS